MSAAVSTRMAGEVAVVRFANPPLNTIDASLRDALTKALEEIGAKENARAVVLVGAGRHFAAGPPLEPTEPPEAAPPLAVLCARIEAFPLPVVAAVSGMCLGPGLEIALAAAARVAAPTARLGFPEVTLGLTPRAGGSQRLVRLAGPAAALEILLEGAPVPAARAAAIGLVDQVAEGADPLPEALEVALALASGGRPRRRASEVTTGIADGAALLSEVAIARRAVEGSRLMAPGRIVDCVEAAGLLPWEAALAFESAAFDDCAASAESRALRHVMRAELAADVPGAEAARAARAVRSLGFCDCGARGRWLALRALERGLMVTVAAADGARAAEIRERIEAEGRGRTASGTLSFTLDPGALALTDAVIEAGTGDAAARGARLGALAPRVPSSVPVLALVSEGDELDALRAAAGPVAGGVTGLRLGRRGRLAELVTPADAGADGGAEAAAAMRALALMPVIARGGAISEALRVAMERAAGWLVEAGFGPAEVDRALREAGFAQGPFEAMDAEGLDRAARRLTRAAPGRPPLPLVRRLLDVGRKGRESGRGFYLHAPDGGVSEDARLSELLRGLRAERGELVPHIRPDDALMRVELAMANCGARLIAGGVARAAADIDLVAVHALGYPRWRGGPMMTAELMGVVTARKRLVTYAGDDPEIWDPAPLWLELFKRGLHPAEVTDRELVSSDLPE